jgi:hypothetical protein
LLHSFSSLVEHFFGGSQIVVTLCHGLTKLDVLEHQTLKSSLHGAPSLQQVFRHFFELLQVGAIINGPFVYRQGKFPFG